MTIEQEQNNKNLNKPDFLLFTFQHSHRLFVCVFMENFSKQEKSLFTKIITLKRITLVHKCKQLFVIYWHALAERLHIRHYKHLRTKILFKKTDALFVIRCLFIVHFNLVNVFYCTFASTN